MLESKIGYAIPVLSKLLIHNTAITDHDKEYLFE